VAQEGLPVEDQELAVGERPDRSGAGVLRDQRHLAEEIAVAEVGDRDLVALGLLHQDLAAAFLDDEEGVALVALVDDHRALRRESRVQLARERAEESVGKREKDRHPLEDREAAAELVRCRFAAAR